MSDENQEKKKTGSGAIGGCLFGIIVLAIGAFTLDRCTNNVEPSKPREKPYTQSEIDEMRTGDDSVQEHGQIGR